MRLAPVLIAGFAALALASRPVSGGAAGPAEPAAPPGVLLLHSYHKGFEWTDKVTLGLERGLAEAGRPVELTVRYMDAKRVNDTAHFENLRRLYRHAFPTGIFQVVVTADDDAFRFAIENRTELFPGVPIVFCGLSGLPGPDAARDGPVTGIVETQDIGPTLELALELHPRVRGVLVINDRTTTGIARQRQIDAVAARIADRAAVETVDDVDAEELAAALRALGPADLVFLEAFNRDRAGRVYNPREIMRLVLGATSRPVYTVKEEYLGLGVAGGYLTAGETHGEAAAGIARQILDGGDAALIPVVVAGVNRPMFDDAVLRRFRIDRKRLPPGSILLNRQAGFVEQHRALVTGTGVAFLLLLGIIAALVVNVRVRHRAEEDLAITLNSIGDAVIATDLRGRVTQLNPVAARLTGWPEKDARGRDLAEVLRLVRADTREPLAAFAAPVLERGETVTTPQQALLIARDGAERRVSDSAAPIRGQGGEIRGMVVVFRDITERVLMEERYRQAQKMETVGRLAGGVAHDFNNLLGGITGYADLLAAGLAGDERLRVYAERIAQTAERAAGLTQSLLAFSRKGTLQEAPIDVHRCVREVIGILTQTIDRRITVQTRLNAGTPVALGDISQIQNALLNLGVNARDAMPTGGTLTFSTEEVLLDEDFNRGSTDTVAPGRYVEVAVSDTGEGMTGDVLEHIFEPFYSTKPVGKGTGLGLAAVYGTVRAHRGTITVTTRPGAGSTFRVYLPLVGSQPDDGARTEACRGSGCILFVDDEGVIRAMGREILRELGYEVVVAGDGREALEIFTKDPSRFGLVILDVTMPRLNGPETFRAMHQVDPGVRVLISSGYDFDSASRDLLSEGVAGFVQKPYRLTELAAAVAGAMAKGPPAAS